jgi:hypothetical protein
MRERKTVVSQSAIAENFVHGHASLVVETKPAKV